MESAGLYVHIPFCISKCSYCDFFSLPLSSFTDDVLDSYIKALLCEAEFFRNYYSVDFWRTVYIGGGTPSLLNERQLATLAEGLLRGVKKMPDEFTIEMNPESLTLEKLSVAGDSGCTRLSLGIQSLCQASLDAVGRNCRASCAQDVLEKVRPFWKGDLSLDAIAGLPLQSDAEFESSLRTILAYSPEHFSLYSLMIEDGTPLEKAISKGKIFFDSDGADDQWLLGRKILEDAGYRQYEVSNFARGGHRGIHNLSYWKQLDYIGVGAGATGTVYRFDRHGEGKGVRLTGTRDIFRYISFWNDFSAEKKAFSALEKDEEKELPLEVEKLDFATLEFEYLMMGLRTTEGVNSLEYKRRFGSLKPWAGDIYLRLSENDVWKDFEAKNFCISKKSPCGGKDFALSRDGLLFLNSLLVNF